MNINKQSQPLPVIFQSVGEFTKIENLPFYNNPNYPKRLLVIASTRRACHFCIHELRLNPRSTKYKYITTKDDAYGLSLSNFDVIAYGDYWKDNCWYQKERELFYSLPNKFITDNVEIQLRKSLPLGRTLTHSGVVLDFEKVSFMFNSYTVEVRCTPSLKQRLFNIPSYQHIYRRKQNHKHTVNAVEGYAIISRCGGLVSEPPIINGSSNKFAVEIEDWHGNLPRGGDIEL